MQLATTQRPHPPPVPPRPSRQVVAEALKRSARPPCPTRQAPPPPNTKPWQSPEQESASSSKTGRTIIYESARDTAERIARDRQGDRNEGNVNVQNAAAKSQNETSNCVLSERNACVSANRVQRPAASSQKLRAHVREDLLESGTKTKTYDQRYDRATNGVVHESPRVSHFPRLRDSIAVPNDRNPSEREENVKFEESETSPIHDRSNGTRVVDASDVELSVPTATTDEKFKDTRLNSLKVESENEPEKNGTTKCTRRPTPFHKSGTRLESTIEKTNARESSSRQENVTNSTILSGDCATVVVVDEPERKVAFEDNDNIHRQDWLEAGVRYSSTKITLPGDDISDRVNDCTRLDDLDFSSIKERIAMSTMQGLPPLPRSLSGFNLNEMRDSGEPPPPPARSSSKSQRSTKSSKLGTKPSPPGRQLTTLDTQLAILRREMFGLRQLDLSLLSQLWSLNESIQDFRQLLQEQEDCPSPSPSSEEGDDTSYDTHPPPPPRRPVPAVHHHRPSRPPRPPRPPPSDDSPSSEEYGAV